MTPADRRRRGADLVGILLVGYAVVLLAPPLANANVVDTVRSLVTSDGVEGAATYAFDFSKYIEGGRAVAAGQPAYSVDGYIYTNVLGRLMAGLSALVPDDARLIALHQLAVCAAWPALAVLVAWGFRTPRFRWGVAVLVWSAEAFREAGRLGNIEFEVLLVALVAFRLANAGRYVTAGVSIGILAALKPFAGLFAVPYAVAWLRSRGQDRHALLFCAATGTCFVALLATDPVVNLDYLLGAANVDIAGRCRGVGLGGVLLDLGLPCSRVVPVALFGGMAFVSVGGWFASHDRTRWALGGLGQPLVNALTSSYVVGYAVFAVIHGAERLEVAVAEARTAHHELAVVAVASTLVMSTNFTGVGLGGTSVGAWLVTLSIVLLGVALLSRRPA